MKIINAKDKKVSEQVSSLPNVGKAIMRILQPVVVVYIQKNLLAGYTEETRLEIDTAVSIQPLTAQQLKMLPEGQRKWKYYTVYALSNLNMQPDEVFSIREKSYRIMSRNDWKEYGYIQYEVIEDYQMDKPDTTTGGGYSTS